jgi:cobalamin biosynthesis protein CbiG
VSKGGVKMAGKYAKYVIPLLGGTSGLYLLADALSDNEAERMPVPVDEDEAVKLAAAELLAQAVS